MTSLENQKSDVKRKNPPSSGGAHHAPATNRKAQKRIKTQNARQTAAQTSDKALCNGELDVEKFVKAREWEIRALEAGMRGAKKALSTRAHQSVPRDMRRRTASHNVKRIPKRLRPRAADEMSKENTPTVNSKTRKPKTSHARLRLETAKRLHGLAVLAKRRKKVEKTGKEGTSTGTAGKAGGLHKIIGRTARPKDKSKARAGTLSAPPQASPKYRKRQVHKTWLPTHLFHSKRAHMTSPKDPLWRFSIPMTPTEKSYRPTHRASGASGAVAWDTSYMATIGLEGTEDSIERVLRALGVCGRQGVSELEARGERRWREGRRSWAGWTSLQPSVGPGEMCPVTIIWCATVASPRGGKDGPATLQATPKKAHMASQAPRRKLFIRVHPAAFLTLWNATLLLAKKQNPQVMVEDLRFEIGSIEVTGPSSTEVLLGALHPVKKQNHLPTDVDDAGRVWQKLRGLTNPAALPPGALLGLNISDPRLRHPSRTETQPASADDETRLFHILSTWSPDHARVVPMLFDRSARLKACRELPSQKAVNRRKGLAPPGCDPTPLPTDPQIPVLLLACRPSPTGQGSWTVLLPWKCVLPVWYTLMHCPLSTRGKIRFGGLRELRQVSYEAGRPWFPGDYPGTEAGWDWELKERDRRRQEWEKRPKGKRIEWESVDLGGARNGEIGLGWACDWERLVRGRSDRTPLETPDDAMAGQGPRPGGASDRGSALATTGTDVCESSPAPLGIRHVPFHVAASILSPSAQGGNASHSPVSMSGVLINVKVTLVGRGIPSPCARIYRLPTDDSALRERWLGLLPACQRRRSPGPSKLHHHRPETSPVGRRRQLAASLLIGPLPRDGPPQAGDAAYPPVPAEDDLIGFVTTGNFSLGEGKGVAMACLLLERVQAGTKSKASPDRRLCIIREAGKTLGRLGWWDLV